MSRSSPAPGTLQGLCLLSKARIALTVWPLASYLSYLSLDFLITELSMRMQKTGSGCVSSAALTTTMVGTEPGAKGHPHPQTAFLGCVTAIFPKVALHR